LKSQLLSSLKIPGFDNARYAASGGNSQQTQWLVVHDPEKVRRIAGLTIEWMKGMESGS
jgi:nitroreductase